MRRARWFAAAIFVSACDAGATAKPVMDPCSLLTQSDANAFVGHPAVKQPFKLASKNGLVEASISGGVGVHWQHDDRYIVHLKLTGPPTAEPVSKIELMKRLAMKVEAALAR